MSIANLRKDYTLHGLSESDVDADPFRQFQVWFNAALAANLLEPNAMTLATATKDGKPSARIVLLKGFDERGFVFYTNYESRKGHELAENPQAALVFRWAELERQVRVEGLVEKCSAVESDAYFHSRPVGSQLGACVSQQSQVIDSREVLEARLEELMLENANQEIARPAYWGGSRLNPSSLEFWQGRPNRLHDRLRYRLTDGGWLIERLSP
ncbi:MAG: pyridoxamine 5'-phosphate oxidase [Ktedonobacteraceae bacterium]|nr:pyridoxamine 5'-phosphate oxidase [Ktedonobacteraceae bacterium]